MCYRLVGDAYRQRPTVCLSHLSSLDRRGGQNSCFRSTVFITVNRSVVSSLRYRDLIPTSNCRVSNRGPENESRYPTDQRRSSTALCSGPFVIYSTVPWSWHCAQTVIVVEQEQSLPPSLMRALHQLAPSQNGPCCMSSHVPQKT
nr:hypothetical protein CFP56_03083 [Quercus suber]